LSACRGNSRANVLPLPPPVLLHFAMKMRSRFWRMGVVD
jgi:hypothetical protein